MPTQTSLTRIARMRIVLSCAAALFVVVGIQMSGFACDTPVYRYAMYRWEPAPYEVYHFHRGEISPEFAAVRKAVGKLNSDKVSPTNLAVYPVDLDADPELTTVPPYVRQAWEEKLSQGAKLPLTTIINPALHEVYTGDLASKQIPALTNSPNRREIADQLKKGNAGVYLLLLGKDEAMNSEAEKAVDKLVADVNSGDLKLYAGPDSFSPLIPQVTPSANDSKDEEGEAAADKKAKDDKPPHQIASMKFTREDLQASDPWLYRNLMAVEGDLHKFPDEPMLFVVYGRGRALPPYIGKGIAFDNLVEITEFITGACSCTVKEQNPGVDLLMTYDWESASAALVEKFGDEEGNHQSLAELFPQLIIPSDGSEGESPGDNDSDPDAGVETNIVTDNGTASEDKTDGEGADSSGGSAAGTSTLVKRDSEEPESGEGDDVDAAPANANADTDKDSGNTVALSTNPTDESPGTAASNSGSESAGGSNLMVTLGVGLGVAFVVLLAATFLILKPQ